MSRATLLRVLATSLLAVAGGSAVQATEAAENSTTVKRAYDLVLAVPAITKAQGAVNDAELRKAELDEEVTRFGEPSRRTPSRASVSRK